MLLYIISYIPALEPQAPQGPYAWSCPNPVGAESEEAPTKLESSRPKESSTYFPGAFRIRPGSSSIKVPILPNAPAPTPRAPSTK